MTQTITLLRDTIPIRKLTFVETLRTAELQAAKFVALAGLTGPPFPDSAITSLPRVQVERMTPAPVSGATQWSRGRWLILINGADPIGRQRFSLAHEFKHVLDHPFIGTLYPATPGMTAREREEQVCDYFAGSLLMPRPWLKRSWASGTQDLRSLAREFEVSRAAMRVRLLQVGLIQPAERCEYVGAAR